MKTYDVLTITGDGIELWKNSLTYEEAKAEIESAKAEFGWKIGSRVSIIDRCEGETVSYYPQRLYQECLESSP